MPLLSAAYFGDAAGASRLLHRFCGFPSPCWPSLRAVHQAVEPDEPYENKFSTERRLSAEPLALTSITKGIKILLNCTNFDEILVCSADSAKITLKSNFDVTEISFNEIEKFPDNHGLYFVFLGEEVFYIGKADKQTLKERCRQYIGTSSGATLRKKIECVKSCNEIDAISYIKKNLSAKFITEIDVDEIPVIEEVAIWAFQSKLNAIKPNSFTYAKLSFN